mmetsp:Transcript_18642/g.51118  ORF Transcript_18642/g.51118 Transcript_18642/m.51118 type:complete len:361 (+) Transcript_18642:63-1145(+)|eukprot:CAMPEP_0117496888 /NCGR_PEP_ID=MMETSP0784-20121206/20893_1 /TAXON_ID=39447 /ORGANISM="" /LENGTH=360 /DNA_ID=CAMNT_0005291881 /DNA_START=62 /DNA_END=1144 /DNA_ORIENTATION=+
MLCHVFRRSPLTAAVGRRFSSATSSLFPSTDLKSKVDISNGRQAKLQQQQQMSALSSETEVRQQIDIIAAEQAKLQQQMSAMLMQTQALGVQLEVLSKAIGDRNNLVWSRTVIGAEQQRPGIMAERPVSKSSPEEAKRWRDQYSRFRPAIDEVAYLPTHVSQIGNIPLFQLALHGSHSAQKERLIREIMRVDGVSWEDAHNKLIEMDLDNEKYYWFDTLPYRVGIVAAVLGGTLGTLLVFWKPLAEIYGTCVAGEELPEGVEDISSMTTNQVGTWTWAWMEPMIGVASFVILCSQFARGQMWKLNMRPYTEDMLRRRANRLAGMHPHYDREVVRAWAKHLPRTNYSGMPSFRRSLGWKAI